LHTTPSHDELVAKLQQIGLSAPSVQLATVTYAPKLTSLVLTFAFYALVFAAVWDWHILLSGLFSNRKMPLWTLARVAALIEELAGWRRRQSASRLVGDACP
jgi:hypothetical protein